MQQGTGRARAGHRGNKNTPTTETENPAKLAPNRRPGRIVQGHTKTPLKRVVDGLKQEVEHEILCIIFV